MKTLLFYLIFSGNLYTADIDAPMVLTYKDQVYEGYTVKELKEEFVAYYKPKINRKTN
jgi:hypothetical protein